MLSDEKICQVVGSVRYKHIDGNMVLVPIEERNDETLTIAKDVARLQYAKDLQDLCQHQATGLQGKNGELIFIYPIEEWQKKWGYGVRPKIKTNKPQGG